MPIDHNHPFTIEEVNNSHSQYLYGMNSWLEHIFPEYCPTRFDKLLSKLQPLDGKDQIQIFIGLVENQIVGLMQLFYKEWRGGLSADIDLLGVLEPFRRSGLAVALIQRSLQAIHDMALLYQIPSIGITTLIDPKYAPIVNLHQKLGGQIRRDYPYSSGDLIVWYPTQEKYASISTAILGDQLKLFGKLLDNQ